MVHTRETMYFKVNHSTCIQEFWETIIWEGRDYNFYGNLQGKGLD